jgi:hypothetical protein
MNNNYSYDDYNNKKLIFIFPTKCQCDIARYYNKHCLYCNTNVCDDCKINIDISGKLIKDLVIIFNEYIGIICKLCFDENINLNQMEKTE